jgi:hypothetical protein
VSGLWVSFILLPVAQLPELSQRASSQFANHWGFAFCLVVRRAPIFQLPESASIHFHPTLHPTHVHQTLIEEVQRVSYPLETHIPLIKHRNLTRLQSAAVRDFATSLPTLCWQEPHSPINMSKPLETHLYRRRRRKVYDFKAVGKNALWITIGTSCALILWRYDPSHTQTLGPFWTLETTSIWIEDRCPAPMDHLDCLFWDPIWVVVKACSRIQDLTFDVWSRMVRLLAFPIQSYSLIKSLQEQLYPRLEFIPRLLRDPPPILFIAAGIGFVIAITAFRYSHRGDRYQDYIHIVGMTLGIVVASQMENFLMAAKGCLAWSTILALVVSVLLHRLLNTSSEVE